MNIEKLVQEQNQDKAIQLNFEFENGKKATLTIFTDGINLNNNAFLKKVTQLIKKEQKHKSCTTANIITNTNGILEMTIINDEFIGDLKSN